MGHEKRMIKLLHSDLWKLRAAIVLIFPKNHHNRRRLLFGKYMT